VQGLIRCGDHVPDSLLIGDEFDSVALEIRYGRAGLLGDIDSGKYIDEGLLAGEVAVYFTFGDIGKSVRGRRNFAGFIMYDSMLAPSILVTSGRPIDSRYFLSSFTL